MILAPPRTPPQSIRNRVGSEIRPKALPSPLPPPTKPRTREANNAKLLTDLGIQNTDTAILRLNGKVQLERINSERRKEGLKPINQFLIS